MLQLKHIMETKHVVIVGGGFAGVELARNLKFSKRWFM